MPWLCGSTCAVSGLYGGVGTQRARRNASAAPLSFQRTRRSVWSTGCVYPRANELMFVPAALDPGNPCADWTLRR